ncbi:hypothetical protein HY338_02000, partial [Candidatus Gottesmanbacteria bacterium]|nr:hypothetical protein [Candidatus Gottesmanbacteria bacterium]
MNITDYHTNRFPTWCPGCVLPGTLINSNPSIKKIEVLKEGDKILGSDGKYHTVSKTYVHKHIGKLFKITSKYFGSTVLTPEHPVLIVKREHKKLHNKNFPIIWQEAEYLKKGDYLLYPISQDTVDITNIEIPWVKKEKDTRSKTIPRYVKVDEKFLLLAGLYIAEGWTHRRSINYCFHLGEIKLGQKTLKYFEDVFGIKGRLVIKKKKNTIDLIFNSSLLSRVFDNWFAKGAPNKKIPHFLLTLPTQKQKWLIQGLWLG